MDFGLKGKVALVAGGSQGLGLAVAMDFAREGAKVAICALDDPHLPEAAEAVRLPRKATSSLWFTTSRSRAASRR